MRLMMRFVADESGATSIEYALLASMFALAAATAWAAFGEAMSNMFLNTSNTITSAL